MKKHLSCLKKIKKTPYHYLIFFLIIYLQSCNSDSNFEAISTDTNVTVTKKLTYTNKACCSCDFVIEASEWQFDGAKYSKASGLDYVLKPGDTIGITGTTNGKREGLNIKNVNGTKENPIVFINCDGSTELGSDKNVSSGITIENSKYFKIAGTGDTQSQYGIKLRGFMGLEARDKCTNYEIYGVEVLEAGYAGIICRTDAACDGSIESTFVQYNTFLHHNKVHDTGGEGFYVGGSHWNSGQTEQPGCVGTLLWEPQLKGVKVYENYVYNTGRDGIQVGSAIEDCEIYNNTVVDYGLAEEYGHIAGFQINPGTTGKVYNNKIYDGKGFGIFCVGQGGNLIYNNLIVNAKLDAIYTDERLKEDSNRDWHFKYFNNTIIRPGGYAFNFNSNNTVGNEIKNNIASIPEDGFIIGWENYDASNNIFTDKDTLNFKNPSEYDFSSPKVGFGLDITNHGIVTDILGNIRPKKNNDIGAFQYQ